MHQPTPLHRSNRIAGASPWVVSICCAAVLALAGCKPSGADPSAAAMGPPPVSVAPAIERPVQDADEFTGRLEATETVELRPRVAGYVQKVHFKAGQEVRKGDLLFSIDASPFRAELARAEAQLNAARTQADLAKTEQARARRLLDLKAISQQEYDQLNSSLRNAEANARAAEAAVATTELNVGYAEIRAPISGRISRENVTVGNLVSVGEPVLTTIVSLDKVYAYFDASEQSYLRYVQQTQSGQKDKQDAAKVMMGLANEDGYPHQGAINFVDNRLNAQTGAIRVRAVFDNAERRFTPGMFARIKLIGSQSYTAVLTPDRAVGTDQSKRFVLVVGEGNTPQFREVKLGQVVDGMRVIQSGLKAGELVVVNGLQRVRPGMPVTPERLEIDASGMPIDKPATANGPPAKGAQTQADSAPRT